MSHSQTQAMYFPKPPKIITKFSQNPAKILPKPSQNAPKNTPNQWKFQFWSPKWPKRKKNCLPSMLPWLLDAILAPKASPVRPKSVPKAPKIYPKTWKNQHQKTCRFWTCFFHCFGEVLGSVWDEFLKPKRVQTANDNNLKNAIKHRPWRQNQGLALTTKDQNL